MSTDDVMGLVKTGQLQEFRDKDKLVFKADQVNLIGGTSDEDVIPLADDEPETFSLASSGSAPAMTADAPNAKEQTGISIFDADATDDSDANAVTRITSSPLAAAEGSKAGSAMLDLTRGDDTSLGASLLEDVYGSGQQPAIGGGNAGGDLAGVGAAEGGALFETTPAEAAGVAPAMAMIAAEPYDGAGSGLVGGAAVGAVFALILGTLAAILGMISQSQGGLLVTLGENLFAVLGGMAGLVAICSVLGWVLGRKS
jgi:hypothetical protein